MNRHEASGRPKIAIIDNNTLAILGLKQILQNVMPIMTIETFSNFDELENNNTDGFFHYFVSIKIVLEHRAFFLERKQKTFVLTTSSDPNSQLSDFRCLSINVSEDQLIKSLLMLAQHGHSHGKNLPPMPNVLKAKILSDREIEVLSLVAQGYINKEIADQLNIGMTTVITHRKNIQEKLGLKSVSALTIYAVMHGYVDINKI
ncbi:transcriptional regulator, LuxR family [Prevotella sp. DNF00663]|uniref:response regulator transcription factor n=1 Tax=unclassified Prevotella TaxID=2638335 RepID=UPI0005130650|nr:MULTISPECIES: response regulator transcription factor [unclassified Prevotella]KGI60711.1 LuxR family transcriptional regulator [Prevotella sp. S7 MS 2]KXB84926.1 transcriptional regulator, LuxR family [Prevotella sp. DNF00663]